MKAKQSTRAKKAKFEEQNPQQREPQSEPIPEITKEEAVIVEERRSIEENVAPVPSGNQVQQQQVVVTGPEESKQEKEVVEEEPPRPAPKPAKRRAAAKRELRAKFENQANRVPVPSDIAEPSTSPSSPFPADEPKISRPLEPVKPEPDREDKGDEKKNEILPGAEEEKSKVVDLSSALSSETTKDDDPLEAVQPLPTTSILKTAKLDTLESETGSNPLQEPIEPVVSTQVEEINVDTKQPDLTSKRQKSGGQKKRKKSKTSGQHEDGLTPRPKLPAEKITFSDRIVRVALKYTRAPTRALAKRMPGLRDNLLRSNMRISPEGLIAVSLLATFLAIPAVGFGMYELTRMGFGLEALALPGVLVVPFFLGTSLPKASASSRASGLDNEMPYLFAYITVLAGGGISPIVTLKRITKASKIFPAAAKEASRILMDIDIFGLDAITALEREARLTPNKVWSDFVGGYVAVLKTGGDALSYLEAKLKEIFSIRESKLKASSEFVATMSEAYIIMTVVMGVSLMVLWATQNLMSPNGLANSNTNVNSTIIVMFSGVAVPIISLLFIIVIGSSQVNEPFSFDMPFYIFLGCIPIGALIYFFAPLPVASYEKLAIGLLVMSIPPMIFQMRFKKSKLAVEAKLPNFLRDISEVRKTGLAPEKTIEQIANRNYGALSVHIKKIAAQLSWGTPMKTVLSSFISEVKSWVARAVAFLLLEVVDVGGGSAKMFISLADFTEKNAQLEKDRRSQIRPYIIIPYIGAILIVATSAMMVYYVSAPGIPNVEGLTSFLPSPALVQKAIGVLLLCAFFQAWVMGFVAGKMGEGSAADGFKHATLLVIISLITVIAASALIGGAST